MLPSFPRAIERIVVPDNRSVEPRSWVRSLLSLRSLWIASQLSCDNHFVLRADRNGTVKIIYIIRITTQDKSRSNEFCEVAVEFRYKCIFRNK